MAIGQVKLQGTQRAGSSTAVDPNAFGAGVGQALTSLSGSLRNKDQARERLAAAQAARGERTESFQAQESFIRFQNEQGRAQEARIRNADRFGTELTNATESESGAANATWLADVPEALRPEYSAKLALLQEQQINSSYAAEYTLANRAFSSDITDRVSDLAQMITDGTNTGPQSVEEISILIEASDLPALQKETMLAGAEQILLKADYMQHASAILYSQTPVREADGTDAVLGGIQGWQRGLLNGIAKPESGGDYTIRYGGADGPQYFTDFSDHPRQFATITEGPEKGNVSSAAGRYQFIVATWDFIVENAPASLNITDFSPANQDKAALWYAEYVYNASNPDGLNFAQMMQSGNRDLIAQVKNELASTWAGFTSMSDDEFSNIVLGSRGVGGGGNTMPDAATEARYASLDFTTRQQLEQDAGAAVTQMQALADKQAADRLNAQVAQVELLARNGEASADQIRMTAESNGWSADQLNSALAQRDKFIDDGLSSSQVTARMTNNEVFTQSDNDALNSFYRGKMDAIRGGDQEYIQSTLISELAQIGFIPSDVADVLTAQLRSSDPQASQNALRTLAGLSEANPQALAESVRNKTISESVADQARAMQVLSATMTPDEITKINNENNNPALAQQRVELKAQADEVFAAVPVEQLVNKLQAYLVADSSFAADMDDGTRVGFTTDFQEFYREGFVQTRDEGDAWDWAVEKMQQSWAMSPMIGTNRLMKNGPRAMGYPAVGQTMDWINEAVLQEPVIVNTRLANEEVILIPDAQTLGEAQNYVEGSGLHRPSYTMVLIDPVTGAQRVVSNDQGGAYRIAFDPAKARKAAITDGQLINLEAQRAELDRELTQLEDRQLLEEAQPQRGEGAVTPDAELEAEIRAGSKRITQLDNAIAEATAQGQSSSYENISTTLADQNSLEELEIMAARPIYSGAYMAPAIARAIEIAKERPQAGGDN